MPNVFLGLLGGVLLLRLFIWQFLHNPTPFFREDFSDVTVAVSIIFITLFWFASKFIQREANQKSQLELPIFLLLGAAVVSLFHSVDFSSSFKSVLVLSTEILFFYMLINLLSTPKRLRWALIFLMGITFIVALYGVIQFFILWTRHSSPEDLLALSKTDNNLYYVVINRRAISFLGWPNTLAGYLLLFLPLSIILPFYLKKNWQKVLSTLVLLIILDCFLYTFSFLGWMSFILSTLVILPFFWNKMGIKSWSKEKKRMILYGLITFFVLFLWVIFRKNFLSSLSPRLSYYKVAFLQLAKNPLWGCGWDSFAIICRSLTFDKGNLTAYVHNSYLQIWIETGVIGFTGILLLAVSIFRRSRSAIIEYVKHKDHLILVAIAWGLIAFLIDNLFNYTILKPNIALYWWTMLAVFCAMLNQMKNSNPETKKTSSRVLPGIGFLITLIIFVFLLRMTVGYIYYYQAKNQRPESYKASIELLGKAKIWDPWSSYLPTAAGEKYLQAYSIAGRKELFKQAETNYLEAIRHSPNVYANYLILSKIYTELGDTARGEMYTQKAKELSPAEFSSDSENFR